MKKIFTFLFLLVCCNCLAGGKASVRIGTYNLWMSQLGKGDYAWEVRKARLAQSIADNDIDIFGAQEVSTTIQEELPALILAAGGADYKWIVFSPYKADGGVGNKAQALIYKADKYEVLEFHRFWFSETPEVMSAGWDEQKYKRGGYCAILQDIRSGVKFMIAHAHMPLGQEANMHSAEIMNRMVEKYNTENLPTFFLGDFNTRTDTPTSDYIRENWNDAFLTCRKIVGPAGTFNQAVTDRDIRVTRRIDYIYWRGEGIKLRKYVCNPKKYDGFYPSDHWPVYVDAVIR